MITPQKKPTKTVWNKPKKRKSKLNKDGSKSLATLDKELDEVYAAWIKVRDSKDGMNAECYTCGAIKPLNELQNGHYISRRFKSTKYDERNTHVQCMRCNVILKGNIPNYSVSLVNEFGVDILFELKRLSEKPFKGTREYYISMKDYYLDMLIENDKYGKFEHIIKKYRKV